MPSPAPAAPIPTRARDVGVAVALAAGTALTAIGWASRDPGQWPVAVHGRWVLILWAATAALVLWRGVAVAGAAALLLSALAVATGNVGPLVAVVALAWSSVALGRLVLRAWPTATTLEALLTGLALHATTVSLLAPLPVHYAGTHALLLGLPLLANRRVATRCAVDAWQALRAPAQGSPVQRLAGTGAVAVAAVLMLVAAMPELGHDALVSHLLVPAHVDWAHSWGFDVDRNVWTVVPILADWLYTIGYLLAGETGARLVNVGTVVLVAMLVRDLTRWCGGNDAGANVAALLFLSVPLTLRESSTLHIEGLWTCMVVGGAASLLRAASRTNEGTTRDTRHLAVGGLLLGGALAAKAVTFMLLPPLAAVLVLGLRRWLRRDCRAALAFGLAAFVLIGCVPYVRAWLLTGNPVFPFYNAVFRSPHYPHENFSPPAIFDRGTTWDVLYRMTFESTRFLEARPGAAGFQWLLVVVPAAFGLAFARSRRGLVLLAIAAAALWLTFRETAYLRYVFPSFALACAASGAVLGGAVALGRATRGALLLAVGVAVAGNLRHYEAAGFHGALSLPVLVDETAREDYLTRRSPLRMAIPFVNAVNENHRPVAFFADAFGTGLHADGLWTSWYNHRFLKAVLTARTPDEMGQRIAREGARFLLLSGNWRDETLRALVRAVSDEVHAVGDVSVRRLRDEFRFRDELLQAPRFEDAASWHVMAGAAVEPNAGARVHGAASVTQRVEVVAGREYRLAARVRRAAPSDAASARLQVNWHAADGRRLHTDIEVVACEPETRLHSMDRVAPAGATHAVVFATAHGDAPALFESLSFRN